MTIPDYQALMLPVLRLAADGEMRVPEAAERIADALGLTAGERDELLPSGRQRVLHNRIHWAKFYMAKAGLIASPARPLHRHRGRTRARRQPARAPRHALSRDLPGLPRLLPQPGGAGRR